MSNQKLIPITISHPNPAQLTNHSSCTSPSSTQAQHKLLLHIFAFAPLTSYIPLTLTCQRFHKLVHNNQSLFKTWCMPKFPEYITSTTPLPSGLDYKWLLMCLYNEIPTDQDDQELHVRKYGHVKTLDHLHIRSIIHITNRQYEIDVTAQGISYDIAARIYRIGILHNHKLEGQGTYITPNLTYQGEFVNDEYHGLGTLTCKNGKMYHGDFFVNCKIGQGTCTFEDGSCYVGQWYNDMMFGNGTYRWPNGDKYVGQWRNDKQHGHGSYHWANGDRYVGQFQNDSFHGLGKLSRCVGGQTIQVYSGMWRAGVPRDCDLDYMYRQCLSKIKR